MEKTLITLFMAGIFIGINQQTFAQTKSLKQAYWITAPDTINCPIFQKNLHIDKPVKQAILTITAHGLYEATINGRRVSNALFTPGFTGYNKRLQYQSYKANNLLKQGHNKIQVTLSGGWYSGLFGEEMQTGWYGNQSALLLQLVITFIDGSKQIVTSDSTWLCGSGPVRYADFYNGEVQDERMKPGNWKKVTIENDTKDNLVPTISKPVTEQETFRPKRIFKDLKGETIIDFGQNLAGWVRLKVKGKVGDTIKIAHAELLDEQRNFYTGNLRDAKATDIYILNGKNETLQPHFTYHGFRYAKVSGFTPTVSNCIAVAAHTKLKHTGTFSCADPMLNQLQHNIEWSLNSNFVDIPTDCPQRSERFGWTGDAQVFCATASFNRNTLYFYKKWLADLKAGQGSNGAVPQIIPDFEQQKDTIKEGYAGWGDAATIMPWTLYLVYGDKAVLAAQYNSMKAWVDYIHDQSKNNLWTANGYGDWYAMGDKTSLPLIDQCFYYHSTELLVDAARVLNKTEDVKTYTELTQKIKSAFQTTYVNFDTKGTRTQTAYILALQFGLLPEGLRQKAADSLAQRIHQNNDHLATGFLGTPYLLFVLTQYGYTQLAYTLLLQKTCPSWLYPVTKGATTIWERWDAIRPDATIQQCSFNHYAYGAVGQWLYEDMAGIKALSPGYKTIMIQPHPDSRVKWAKAAYTCPNGKIVSGWKVQGKRMIYSITIPRHTTATVQLPDEAKRIVKPGHYTFTTHLKTNNL